MPLGVGIPKHRPLHVMGWLQRHSAAALLGVTLTIIAAGLAYGDQTSPYCNSDYEPYDKYQCATTVSYFDGYSRTITNFMWNGSLGEGGFNCCWQLAAISVWDTYNGSPRHQAEYGSEQNMHSNEDYFSSPIGFSFDDYGVASDPWVFYCFYFHSNAQYIGTQYYPPITAYGEWRNYLDYGTSTDEGMIGCP